MVVGMIVASSVSRILCAHRSGETPIVLLHKDQEDQVLRRSGPLYLKTMDRQTLMVKEDDDEVLGSH